MEDFIEDNVGAVDVSRPVVDYSSTSSEDEVNFLKCIELNITIPYFIPGNNCLFIN